VRLRRRDARGASAVEFALVVPLLLMILFGTITTGLTFSDHLSATNAAREAARYGAAADASSASWATSVRDRVKQTYFNSAETITDAQICVRLVQSNGTIAQQWAGTSCGTVPTTTGLTMTPGSCAVLVWMTRPQTIQLLVFGELNFNTRAESVAYYSRVVSTTCTTA
jgi:Flp pilus assembly protein TadG